MQFNSYLFILVFLPLMLAGYFISSRYSMNGGKLFLIAGSAAFYLYGGVEAAFVLVMSIIFNLMMLRILRGTALHRRFFLTLAVAGNIGLLLYYKYTNFILANMNSVLRTEFAPLDLIMPLGISFFTFQQIAYIIQTASWGGGASSKGAVLDYLTYLLYFPKLLMGPLADPADFTAQINDPARRRVDWEQISAGIRLFSYGLFKKLVLADTFAKAVNWGFSNLDKATSMDWFLVMLFYTFQIYFDFSGYSDMAIGVSAMFRLSLPVNFDSPYKALSIRDFWKRWHMSLTGFLTRYVYIPLGGSRRGRAGTCLNVMIVFLVSGIWHGANWTFILWGLLHGLLSVLDRIFEKPKKRLMETVRWAATFLEVNLLWLLFRSESVAQWKDILMKMFTFQDMSVSDGLLKTFLLPETQLLQDLLHLGTLNQNVRGLWLLLFLLGAMLLCLIPENNCKSISENHYFHAVLAAGAFVWAFLCISSESVFVYFNF